VNVRILAATHRNRNSGPFRRIPKDLFYRLDVVSIVVPPLRQRKEDIPEFVAHFSSRPRRSIRKARSKRFRGGVDKLSRQPWPGNVRELSHTVERLCSLVATPRLGGDLPEIPSATAGPADLEFSGKILPIRELQSRYAAWALAQVGDTGARRLSNLESTQDAVEVASPRSEDTEGDLSARETEVR